MKIVAHSIVPTHSLPYLHIGYIAAKTPSAKEVLYDFCVPFCLTAAIIVFISARFIIYQKHKRAIALLSITLLLTITAVATTYLVFGKEGRYLHPEAMRRMREHEMRMKSKKTQSVNPVKSIGINERRKP